MKAVFGCQVVFLHYKYLFTLVLVSRTTRKEK
jgi:hypothetical protein